MFKICQQEFIKEEEIHYIDLDGNKILTTKYRCSKCAYPKSIDKPDQTGKS